MNARRLSFPVLAIVVFALSAPAAAQIRLPRRGISVRAPKVTKTRVEGEQMLAQAQSRDGRVQRQEMSGFGRGWSGNAQLFWAATRRGGSLRLVISAPADGHYFLGGAFTNAPDFGNAQLFVNQVATSGAINTYASRVMHTGEMTLGAARLKKGANMVEFRIMGKDRRSKGYRLGIDYLTLSHTPTMLKSTTGRLRVTTGKVALRPRLFLMKNFRFITPFKVSPRAIRFNQLYLPTVDLRPTIRSMNLAVRSQGNRGTCSIHAMTFLHEYMYNKRFGLRFNDLSEEYLNYVTNLATGTNGDGDFFHNIETGYQKYGAYPESLVPYKAVFDPDFKPSQAYLDVASNWPKLTIDVVMPNTGDGDVMGASKAQLKRTVDYLRKSIPVAIGCRFPKSSHFEASRRTVHGVLMMDNLDSIPKNGSGGHSVVLVGYLESPRFPGGGYFIFRNSWGGGEGGFWDRGYGVMSFDYVLKYTYDLVAYQ